MKAIIILIHLKILHEAVFHLYPCFAFIKKRYDKESISGLKKTTAIIQTCSKI